MTSSDDHAPKPSGKCCDNGNFGEEHQCQKQKPEAPREWILDAGDSINDGPQIVGPESVHVIEKSPDKMQVGEHTVLVDSEDYIFLSRFSWSIKQDKNTFYAKTNVTIGGKTTSVSMHRLVSGLANSEIDHVDRNGLNNRKSNLRFCSSKENSRNRVRKNKFGLRGVYQRKGDAKYSCQILTDAGRIQKHDFETPEDAAKAYDQLSKEFHGEFGIRNFKD